MDWGQHDENEEEHKNQEKVVNDYISEINVCVEEGKIVLEYIWDTVLFLIPITIFALCVAYSLRGKELIATFIR